MSFSGTATKLSANFRISSESWKRSAEGNRFIQLFFKFFDDSIGPN